MLKRITEEQIQMLIKNNREVKLIKIIHNGHTPQADAPFELIAIREKEIEETSTKLFKKNDIIVLYTDKDNWENNADIAKKLSTLGFVNIMEYRRGSNGYEEIDFTLG